MSKSKFILATTAIIGTMIGAGILGIPYVIMQSGFLIGTIHLILLGLIMTIVMLYLGEVALRTKGNHQLTGLAERYLGKRGKIIMFLAIASGVYAALIAYLIGESESLSLIFFGGTEYSIYFSVAFWIAMSAMTYFGIKAMEEGDYFGAIAVALLILSIIFVYSKKIDTANLSTINYGNFFVPFGVIFFAFLAETIVPEVKRILNKEPEKIKSSIIFAYVFGFVVYLIFSLIVVGFKGLDTPPIATFSLGKIFVLLGILTMFTSYLSLSIALIDNLRFDFGMKKANAWLLVSIFPFLTYLLLFITKNLNFTAVLGIGGVISGGLTGILVLIMAAKAKKEGDKKPAYSIPFSKSLAILISLIFIIATILEIMRELS